MISIVQPKPLDTRSVPEWIGKTPDTKPPPRVKRKSPGAPLSLDYFEERSIPEPNTGCWLWECAVAWNGYGAIRFAGRTRRAHRACFEVSNQVAVPRHLDVCHRCDTRACVNPEHLFVGTRADNMRDCRDKGRARPLQNGPGERCPAAKLTAAQVDEVRKSGRSARSLAREWGVNHGTILQIRHGKTWRGA